jgi:tRNA (guanine37-N1)-methyltransferase
VPKVLLGGHHAKIEAFRLEDSIERTKKYRKDLYEKYISTTENKNNRK